MLGKLLGKLAGNLFGDWHFWDAGPTPPLGTAACVEGGLRRKCLVKGGLRCCEGSCNMSRPIPVGNVMILRGEFYVDGELTDPDDVSGESQLEDGSIATVNYPDDAALVRVSKGIYDLYVAATDRGLWSLGVYGTGSAEGSIQATFEARDAFTR